MSDAPNWHDLPDRTNDAGVKRARRHKAVIALAKRATRGRSYEFMRVVSIDRRLFGPFMWWNGRLMPFGKLKRSETEAVILRTAWLCRSKYEWTQHVAIGKSAGLTDEQIEAIGADPTSEVFDEKTRALLAAVPELLESHALAPETFDALGKHFTPAQTLEFVMLVGNYAMLAGALNSFGVPFESVWQ